MSESPVYRYADGNGNVYTLSKSGVIHTLEYDPVSPAESSSGVYSGGEYVKKTIAREDYEIMTTELEKAAKNASSHIANRLMGSGLIIIEFQEKTEQFILSPGAKEKTLIEAALKKPLN